VYVDLIFPDGATASRVFAPGALAPYITRLANQKGFGIQTSEHDGEGRSERSVYDAAEVREWMSGVAAVEPEPPGFGEAEDERVNFTDPAPRRVAGVLSGVFAGVVAASFAAPPIAAIAFGAAAGYGVWRWFGTLGRVSR
jgi:hypothetical protein